MEGAVVGSRSPSSSRVSLSLSSSSKESSFSGSDSG